MLQNSHGSRKSSRSRVNSFNAGERQEIGDSVRFDKPNGGIENAFGRRKVSKARATAPSHLAVPAVCAMQHLLQLGPQPDSALGLWDERTGLAGGAATVQSGAIGLTSLHAQDPENVFAVFRTTARPSAAAAEDASDADPLSEPEAAPMQRQSSRLPSALFASDRRCGQLCMCTGLLCTRGRS